MNKKIILLGIYFLLSGSAFAMNAYNPAVKITPSGNVVEAYRVTTDAYQQIIVGAVGLFGSSPNTWIQTNLSANIAGNMNLPTLFSNVNGDVVILSDYLDVAVSPPIKRVVAAVLPRDATIWNVQIISGNQNAQNSDEVASIDESGNIIVSWTYNDSVNSAPRIGGATTTLSTLVWSAPFTVSQ